MKTLTGHPKLTLLVIAVCLLFYIPSSAQTPIFYGMTAAGGTNNNGTIFSFNPATDTEIITWSFQGGPDGMQPYGSLVYDTGRGLYYGLTSQGGSQVSGGTIFSFDPVNNKEAVLDTMGVNVGQLPQSDLAHDPVNGWYYGMTNSGGINNVGTIFGFDPVNDTMIVYWSFGNDTDGQYPDGRFTYNGSNGLFYGMTNEGGANSVGTIISFDPVTHTEKMLWSFGNDTDGQFPNGSLTYDSVNGLFYGMTYTGGSTAHGMIFSFNPANNAETPVWEFGDQGGPMGDLVYIADKNLFYGLTSASNNDIGAGTIFSFDPATNTQNILYSFAKTLTDGQEPQGNLTLGPGSGLFYGMTKYGGIYDEGTIFSFNPANDTEALVWNFGGGTDGFYPYGTLSLYTPPTKMGLPVLNQPVAQVNVYPDPTNGQLNVTGLTAGQIVQVYNYLGQKITGSSIENTTQQIDISSQPNGVYLIQVLSKDGVPVSEQRVVKVN